MNLEDSLKRYQQYESKLGNNTINISEFEASLKLFMILNPHSNKNQNNRISKPQQYNNPPIDMKSSSFTNNQLLTKERPKTLISSNFQNNMFKNSSTQSCLFSSNWNKELFRSLDNFDY